ncbi:site-specific integrase [Actinomadura sp. 7K507]|uniref:site-specific integrase n=1 Tax=Actinomadura sp. 7K507 TaxID=2530365 RepID=UPI001052FCFF|nr:site-specific integrase [Actinomadura sp. 7K507]TDC75530.1 site-specific integrase [Actinomadura sp. 7K507]
MTGTTSGQSAAGVVAWPQGSPFAGMDICAAAGLALRPGATGPIFDQDVWDFSGVAGLPAYLQPSFRRLEFISITYPAWRLVAKEHMAALLVPGHERVRLLPGARRHPLAVTSCAQHLDHLTCWLNWLTARGITGLGEVTNALCQEFAAERARRTDADGTMIGDRPHARYRALQTVSELARYRDLYTADRYSSEVTVAAGAPKVRGLGPVENRTPVVPDSVFGPMLAAALYVTGVLGPHITDLLAERASLQVRRQESTLKDPRRPEAVDDVLSVIAGHVAAGRPLDRLPEDRIRARAREGRMRPDDPLLPVSVDALARQAGYRQSHMTAWLPRLRPALEDAVRQVGTAPPWAHDAPVVDRADGNGTLPWTMPLTGKHARDLHDYLRTAAILVTAALSGMRKSELCELTTGCCPPPRELIPGLVRYRITGKVIKRAPLGGTPDEWVVTKEVYDAIAAATKLPRTATAGTSLFGRFTFSLLFRTFRNWVNGPAGQRLGLEPIPPGQVNLRMLRRTLAVELAYRPGGLLAAKIHLKHVSVATTEGYAARPGGSQARFLAEVNKEEHNRNLAIIQAEYSNFQDGIMPSGPGARDLTALFADTAETTSGHQPPTVIPGDQQVRAMLGKRAKTLHLGPANYCWFTDPAKALCLRQAGTPDADQPLLAMCDSARCPQATHHPSHREIWADTVTQHQEFIATLPRSQKTERARLEAELARARRVLAGIDAAASPGKGQPTWDA